MNRHFMNKAHGDHMGMDTEEGEGKKKRAGPGKHSKPPDIHIKSHEHGHTMHVIPQHGEAQSHEFEKGDVAGMHEKLEEHLGHGHHMGGKKGQDHGGSAGEEMEDEFGGGPAV